MPIHNPVAVARVTRSGVDLRSDCGYLTAKKLTDLAQRISKRQLEYIRVAGNQWIALEGFDCAAATNNENTGILFFDVDDASKINELQRRAAIMAARQLAEGWPSFRNDDNATSYVAHEMEDLLLDIMERGERLHWIYGQTNRPAFDLSNIGHPRLQTPYDLVNSAGYHLTGAGERLLDRAHVVSYMKT